MKMGIYIYLTFIMLVLGGYFSNVYKLCNADFNDASSKEEIIRTVGVVIPPVGVVTGYITIER